MKIYFRGTGKILRKAFREWWSKDPFRESAIIAYYSIFSLPGLLVVIITAAGFVFGREAVSGHLSSQISSVMGVETARQVESMVARASETSNSIWATVIGTATILIGATGVFAQFQKSLNIIWEVKADENKSGIWQLIRVRLFSFGLILSVAFILLISLVISSVLAALGEWLTRIYQPLMIALQVVNEIMSIAILGFLFALMFKFFPDAKISWRHVIVGSLVTALLFELGKFALGLYFGKSDPTSGYGAAGSIVLILLWVSYSSMIVFYGAEFTRAYADFHEGSLPASDLARKEVNRKA